MPQTGDINLHYNALVWLELNAATNTVDGQGFSLLRWCKVQVWFSVLEMCELCVKQWQTSHQ